MHLGVANSQLINSGDPLIEVHVSNTFYWKTVLTHYNIKGFVGTCALLFCSFENLLCYSLFIVIFVLQLLC